MLGPGILCASAPLAFVESLRALCAPGHRLLGGFAMLVAFPALAFVMFCLGAEMVRLL